jgi:salicylate hydroxylase
VIFRPKVEKCLILRPIDWQATGDKNTIIKAFSRYSPGVQKIIQDAEENLKVWDLYDMQELPTWTRGHAALIGDAAHPFQPCEYSNTFDTALNPFNVLNDISVMGQGGAMAIEDAISIATLLPHGTAPENIPARLEMYQQSRRPRVEMVLYFTRANGRDENDVTGARVDRRFLTPTMRIMDTDNSSGGNGQVHGHLLLPQRNRAFHKIATR